MQDKNSRCSFIPVVPFASYEEYNALLSSVIVEYQAMVSNGVDRCNLTGWCRYHEGLSFGVKCHWLEHGVHLFMKLTKGTGEGWCMTMNTMVVHALDTSVRVLVKTRKQMYSPMFGDDTDRQDVARLLENETALAICDERCSLNNMSEFRCRNFMSVWNYDYEGDPLDVHYVSIAQAQEMQLAFAMISHPRLAKAASTVKFGNSDLIKLILANVFESIE
jgi:hypothetical protein